MKTLKEIWLSRNPQHELNADGGEDMFWKTAELCLQEYLMQFKINLPTDEEVEQSYPKSGKAT